MNAERKNGGGEMAIRISLNEGQFKGLVEGNSIKVWTTDDGNPAEVMIILQDIGFGRMKRIVNDVERSHAD